MALILQAGEHRTQSGDSWILFRIRLPIEQKLTNKMWLQLNLVNLNIKNCQLIHPASAARSLDRTITSSPIKKKQTSSEYYYGFKNIIFSPQK
jgi:hypothetical protein